MLLFLIIKMRWHIYKDWVANQVILFENTNPASNFARHLNDRWFGYDENLKEIWENEYQRWLNLPQYGFLFDLLMTIDDDVEWHFLINLVLKNSRIKVFESMNDQFVYAKQMSRDVEVAYYVLHWYIIENHFHVVLNDHLSV